MDFLIKKLLALTPKQDQWLRKEAAALAISVNELIRRILDEKRLSK